MITWIIISIVYWFIATGFCLVYFNESSKAYPKAYTLISFILSPIVFPIMLFVTIWDKILN